MRGCKICHCEIRENIRKHEKSQQHIKSIEKIYVDKHVEKNINVDKLKDILYKRITEQNRKFIEFTVLFCWKVDNIEYCITIIKEEIVYTESKLESLANILKRVFKLINIDNFEEYTLMTLSDIKSYHIDIICLNRCL